MFSASSPFVIKSYKNISFETWVQTSLLLNKSLEEKNILIKERKNFLLQLQKFRRFKKSLNINKLSELDKVSFFSIQRRYKRFFGMLWRWTYPSEKVDKEKETDLFSHGFYSFLDEFPWYPIKPKEQLGLDNYLEYPISNWSQVKVFLEKDLKKIIQMAYQKKSLRVLSFNWTITLYDMTEVLLDVNFKNPISLSLSCETLIDLFISQFHFCFESFRDFLSDKHKEEIKYVNTQLIVGWKLSVAKTIGPSLSHLELISKGKDLNVFESQFQDLENKIKGQFEFIQSKQGHVYGHDYGAVDCFLKVKKN